MADDYGRRRAAKRQAGDDLCGSRSVRESRAGSTLARWLPFRSDDAIRLEIASMTWELS